MSPAKVLDVPRTVAGAHKFTCDGFSYTKENSAVKIGLVELWVNERDNTTRPELLCARKNAQNFLVSTRISGGDQATSGVDGERPPLPVGDDAARPFDHASAQ